MPPQTSTASVTRVTAGSGVPLGTDTLQVDDKVYSAKEIAAIHPGQLYTTTSYYSSVSFMYVWFRGGIIRERFRW